MTPCKHILLLCRPGFEKECAAEILELAERRQFPAYIKAQNDSGLVQLVGTGEQDAGALLQQLRFDELIFARQWFVALPKRLQLPQQDRLTPMLDAIAGMNSRFNSIELDYCDTNEGKSLSRFCKQFEPHLMAALQQHKLLQAKAAMRLHCLFLDSQQVYIGYAPLDNSSTLPMGIPRLRMPAAAPSRSTLKLEEAIHWFIADETHYFKPGMRAVDLGAAPGGWSWQLARRGLSVTAIDNGPMDKALLQGGMVEHLRTDAFTWQPGKTVDWLVCDMAERPLLVSKLIARWLSQHHCKHAIFNLKLPMKKRWQAVKDCRDTLTNALQHAGLDYRLRMKHLYHDREEISVCILTMEKQPQQQ